MYFDKLRHEARKSLKNQNEHLVAERKIPFKTLTGSLGRSLGFEVDNVFVGNSFEARGKTFRVELSVSNTELLPEDACISVRSKIDGIDSPARDFEDEFFEAKMFVNYKDPVNTLWIELERNNETIEVLAIIELANIF